MVVHAPDQNSGELHATFSRMVRAQTRLWNAVDARVRAEHGVPLTQVTALRVIAGTEACKVGDLVGTLHITVGGASKVVDRLAAGGYLTRKLNDRDRRSPVLLPTADGRALLDASGLTIEEVLRVELLTRLSATDLASLHRIVGELVADHGTTSGGAS